MSEFEDLVLEYEGGFPGSGPNWAAYEKMKARGRYLEEENARLRDAARWIPVEERLPEREKGGRFSIDVSVVTVGRRVTKAYCNIENRRWIDPETEEYIDITHWRPLPEPPEVE